MTVAARWALEQVVRRTLLWLVDPTDPIVDPEEGRELQAALQHVGRALKLPGF